MWTRMLVALRSMLLDISMKKEVVKDYFNMTLVKHRIKVVQVETTKVALHTNYNLKCVKKEF